MKMNQYIIDAMNDKIDSYGESQMFNKRAYQRVLNHITSMSDELTYDMIYDIPGVGDNIGDFLEDVLDSYTDYAEDCTECSEEFIVNEQNEHIVAALQTKIDSYDDNELYQRIAYQRVLNYIADMENAVTHDNLWNIPGVGQSIGAFLTSLTGSTNPVNQYLIDALKTARDSYDQNAVFQRNAYNRVIDSISKMKNTITLDNISQIDGVGPSINNFLELELIDAGFAC
jgi:DNA polymerase/3'-5' exonuclease PolX